MAQGRGWPCAFFFSRDRRAGTMGRLSGSGAGRGDAKRGEGLQGGTKPARAAQKKRRVAPGVRNTTKHQGDVSEMQFMIEASNRGFGVAKPIGDNERYDVVLDRGRRRFWRVQVKGSGFVHQNGFSVRTCWRTSGKRMPYTPKQIDFLAAVFSGQRTHGRQIWYVIPAPALGGRLGFTLYPFGTREDRHPLFEKYREAWKLLGQPGPRE
jgi:PD-(D/E)XK endonuclease